jgi:5-dehydro-2-deoxygluconokinase
VARPIEQAGSTPLVFEGGGDVGLTLREWPVTQAVKCLVHWQPGDPPAIAEAQARQLQVLGEACRETGHELLLELIANAKNPGDARATVEMIRRVYALGIKPDWWKLAPPEDPAGWRLIEDAIGEADPLCRGVVLLGFDAPLAELEASFAAAARAPICKGFAIGRSIFGQPAEEWLSGKIDDDGAVAAMTRAYGRLIEIWRKARKHATTAAAGAEPLKQIG